MDSGKVGGTPASSEKNWSKFVTLAQPSAVFFREVSEDGKSASVIEVINKSDDVIIFKVKTTTPDNYIVRPNQGSVAPSSTASVKILCQQNVIEVSPSLLITLECNVIKE